MLLKERVNENACGNISELPSQERMRDVNTFFFSGEEFEVLIELRYGPWWREESQSERVSEWVIVASVSRYWVSLLCTGRRNLARRAVGVNRRDANLYQLCMIVLTKRVLSMTKQNCILCVN